VTSLRARDHAIEAKSRSAVLGLYSLDAQLAQANGRLATLNAESASLREQRAALQKQLDIAKHSMRIGQIEIAQRIRMLYETGPVEPLEVVLGAKNLDEAMTNLDSLDRASAQGEQVLSELKAARRSASADARALEAKQSALAAETRAAEATEASLESARTQRALYISSLSAQRQMTERQITTLVARAQAAQARSEQLAAARSAQNAVRQPVGSSSALVSDTTPQQSSPPSGGTSLTVSATGYALPGTTSTGLPVGWGIVAVDPSVIPLGTHMYVPGYGEAVAADTGGAIVGDTIDLWFPSVAQADQWGRRTVTITLH